MAEKKGMATSEQARFLTIGDLRAAIDGLPDDTQIVVTDSLSHTYEQGFYAASPAYLIPWEHDCTDAPEDHKPGRDCPTVLSLELWATSFDELAEKEGE